MFWFNDFLFSARKLGKWSNLTSIFFKWVIQPQCLLSRHSPFTTWCLWKIRGSESSTSNHGTVVQKRDGRLFLWQFLGTNKPMTIQEWYRVPVSGGNWGPVSVLDYVWCWRLRLSFGSSNQLIGLDESDVSHFTIQFIMCLWYISGWPWCWLSGLASYAAACVQDPRFAADLLLKIDVHDELDGASEVVNWTAGVPSNLPPQKFNEWNLRIMVF